MFFSAKPVDEAVFDELRREAAQKGDIVVLPGIFEHYDNITHQTLEILRAASMDPVATHALKVRSLAPINAPEGYLLGTPGIHENSLEMTNTLQGQI